MQANQGSQGTGNQGKPQLSWSQPSSTPKTTATAAAAKMSTPTPAADRSAMSTYIGIFAGGIVLGVLIGWGITGLRSAPTVAENTTSNSKSTTNSSASVSGTNASNAAAAAAVDLSTPSAASGDLLMVSDQSAGLSVSIAKAIVAQPTWVVIYESRNGTAGRALGAHLFFPASMGGETSGTVDLLRGTTPGQTYIAGESLDDGDHIFSTENDKPVRDEKGNPVWITFKTN